MIDRLQNAKLTVHDFILVLGKISKLHIVAELELTPVFNLTHDDLGKCRLALSVLPHKSDLAPSFDQKIQPFDDLVLAITLRNIMGLDHYPARVDRNRETNIHDRIVFLVNVNPLHMLQTLNSLFTVNTTGAADVSQPSVVRK